MPFKGLPRCECGWRLWRFVSESSSQSVIQCEKCGKKRTTKSKYRWKLRRDQEAKS